MRKVLLFMLCALWLSACQEKKAEGFTIDGTLKGDVEGGKVTLENENVDPPVKLDSAIVKDGKFKLAGKIGSPALYTLAIDINKPGKEIDTDNKLLRIDFYLENKPITVEGDVATLRSYYFNLDRMRGKAVIKGSASQDLANKLDAATGKSSEELNKLSKQYEKIYFEAEEAGKAEAKETKERYIEIVKAEKPFNKQIKEATWKFIKENPASVVAFDQASAIVNSETDILRAKEIDELLSTLEGPWAGTKQLEELKEKAAVIKKMCIGEPYMDIELLNNKGKKVMLSSLVPKNKYVLLEFWASWCGPCRAEIPHLKSVHKEYKDFEIISISVDEDEKAWQKAMKEEGMTWTQLRSPSGFGKESPIVKEYNITGVPLCLLLDKEGKFYKANMRGGRLDEFLLEAYGK